MFSGVKQSLCVDDLSVIKYLSLGLDGSHRSLSDLLAPYIIHHKLITSKLNEALSSVLKHYKDSDASQLHVPMEAVAVENNIRGSEQAGKAESLHWPTSALFIKTSKQPLRASY